MQVYVVSYFHSMEKIRGVSEEIRYIDGVFDTEEKANKRVKEFIDKWKLKAEFNIYDIQ